MKHIAVIGAGQLGSRHLQSLASLKEGVSLWVIDPSTDSLRVAKERFAEAGGDLSGNIHFESEMNSLPASLDLVIVATNSKIRKAVVEKLLNHSEVSYMVLEKFLFTKPGDFSVIGARLASSNVKAFVNCPRRMADVYSDIQKQIKGNVNFSITGPQWGLGCNGIHFVDLFAFLTGDKGFSITQQQLDTNVTESKRAGYIEFNGRISGKSGEHQFTMFSSPDADEPFIIRIETPEIKWMIREDKGEMMVSRASNGWKEEAMKFSMPYQSQLSSVFATELLTSGTCRLTAYEESARLHLVLLECFIGFLRTIKNDDKINECLIT